MRLFQTTAFMAILAVAQPAFAQEKQIFVVSDTSILFTMLNPEEAELLRRNVLGLLAERAKRDRDTKLDFIDTTYGRNVLSMYAREFLQGGAKRALDLTAINPKSCSNLTSAFDQLAYSVRISQADEIHIVVISPLVHTGAPCPSIDPYAPVPSEVDTEGFFGNENISSVSFYGVAEEQVQQWDTKFRTAALDKGIEFKIVALNTSNSVVRREELEW